VQPLAAGCRARLGVRTAGGELRPADLADRLPLSLTTLVAAAVVGQAGPGKASQEAVRRMGRQPKFVVDQAVGQTPPENFAQPETSTEATDSRKAKREHGSGPTPR
jgi:hypothetical protein